MEFNGVDFSGWMRVSPRRRLAPTVKDTVYDRVGGDGSVFTGGRMTATTLQLDVRLLLDRSADFAGQRRLISAALITEAPAELVLDDEPGLSYLGRFANSTELSNLWDNGSCRLTFNLYDPVAYGLTRTVTVPSGGSATF